MQVLQKNENILFYLLLLFLPTQLGKHFWPNFSFVAGLRVDLLVVALFLCWVVLSVTKRKKLQKKKTTHHFSLFFTAASFLFLTIFLSGNLLNGLYHLLKFFEFSFVAYYIARTITKTRQIKKIVLILSTGVVLESILALLQYQHQGSLGGFWYFLGERSFSPVTPGIANAAINGQLLLRPYGTFSHPNVLAGFLLISLLLLLFSVTQHQWNKLKLPMIGVLCLGTGALLLTLSRVSILLWVCMLVVFLIVKIQTILYKKKIRFLSILGIVILLLFVFISPVFSRFSHTSLTEESLTQREVLMQRAVAQSVIHPFFGVGFGNFLPVLGTIQQGFSFGVLLQPVHNIYLLVLVETGIVGLSIFLWFLYQTYHRLFLLAHTTKNRWYLFQMLLLSVVLLSGFFDHYLVTIQQGQLLFSVVLGFSWITLHEKSVPR
jgi:O-antigen ligase